MDRDTGADGRSQQGALVIAAAAVAIGAVVLWLLSGVGLGELARYLAYEAVFVVGPGWLVLRAISPRTRSRAWQLVLGWPIGLTLEILAFSLTAALGVRDLFVVYPLLVGLPAALVLRRRTRARPSAEEAAAPLFPPACRWALAGLCLLAFAYFGVGYFTITPLPGTATGVVYPQDVVFHISLAVQALHHWPLTDFRVTGEHLNYHYFSDLHMAAIAQVTGVGLPLIVFRLYLVPLTVLVVLQFGVAGRAIAGRAWAGPLTAALFLLIREIDLLVNESWPIGGFGMFHLWGSPSQLLGIVMFVPALLVLACLLDGGVAERAAPWFRARRGELWALLALLLVGASGAKSVILPMLIGGLIVYLLWARVIERRVDRAALVALGLSISAYAVAFLLMYRGSALGLGFDFPSTIKGMGPLARVHEWWPDGLAADGLYWLLAIPVGTALYFGAPLLGLAWLRWRGVSLTPVAVLSFALLLLGVGAFYFLSDEYFEQTYFTLFGLFAALPFVALGLLRFGDANLALWREHRWWLAAFASGWLATCLVLALVADRLAVAGHPLRSDLVAYLPIALVLGALTVAALRSAAGSRALFVSIAAIVVLLTAALDTPVDVIPGTIRNLHNDAPLYQSSPAGLRPGEVAGMEWIRDHTDQDAVLAVSNDRTPRSRGLAPLNNDFPAFTERRTFREAWAYTQRSNEIGSRRVIELRVDPFPGRRALENAAYGRGDPGAVRTMMSRYGVTHVVISRKDGAVNPGLYRLGRLVFSNGAIDVLELRPPPR